MESFKLDHLTEYEMANANGGELITADTLLGACIVAAFVEVIGDWDNFERGFTGKPYKE